MCASEIHPECSGTADAVLIGEEALIICDLKTGKWAVDVEDNAQLKIYALGALEMFGTDNHKTVETVIVQPTGWHRDGAIRSTTYDIGNLVNWGFDTLRPSALSCFEPDPEPVAGEHCRFCPAKPNCPMHQGEANEIIGQTNKSKLKSPRLVIYGPAGIGKRALQLHCQNQFLCKRKMG